jgi:hypothetical protein
MVLRGIFSHLLGLVFAVFSFGFAQENLDPQEYKKLMREYEFVVGWYCHDARVGDYSEPFLREQIQWQLEYSLTEVGTPEALFLLSKYREVGWDIPKMWEYHITSDF